MWFCCYWPKMGKKVQSLMIFEAKTYHNIPAVVLSRLMISIWSYIDDLDNEDHIESMFEESQ